MAVWPEWVCRNPNCKSYGKSHPNCRCGPLETNPHGEEYAEGGEVRHFCSGANAHSPECEYFQDGGAVPIYADGGKIAPSPNPATTLGHSAAHHGLLAMIKDVGNVSGEQKKHHKTLDKAKEHFSAGNHEKAVKALHGTPLAGSIGQNDLSEIAPHLSGPISSGESNPEGVRAAIDYLHSAIKGHRKLDSQISKLFEPQKASDRLKPDDAGRAELKDFIEHAHEYPQGLLDVGGSIGHYLPEHSVQIGNLAATAINHLNSLRPKNQKNAPLDEDQMPDQAESDAYDRHLDIAQNPMLIMQHVRSGTLQPSDLQTLQALYPALAKSMQSKASESLINAKEKGIEIPYHQRQSLSMLLGQPLDSTMIPANMQAIIASAGPQQIQNQSSGKTKSQNKPTAADLDQFDKVDRLYETPLERRQIDKKS